MTTPIAQDELQGSVIEPPQFSLRSLLLWMTLLGALFGLMSAVGRLWASVLAFALFLIVAHVLGNSLGTKLRDRAGTRRMSDNSHDTIPSSVSQRLPTIEPGELMQHSRLKRITLITSIGGGLIGAALGGTQFFAIYPDSGMAAVALGTISAGVLGCFACFVVSSFLSVARQAIGEALAAGDPDAPSRSSRRPN